MFGGDPKKLRLKNVRDNRISCHINYHALQIILHSASPFPAQGNPVTLQHLQSVQNEAYGVLGGGVPQYIELKDNAAYSSVVTQSATVSQSIAQHSNVAYGASTSVNTEPAYEYPNSYH